MAGLLSRDFFRREPELSLRMAGGIIPKRIQRDLIAYLKAPSTPLSLSAAPCVRSRPDRAWSPGCSHGRCPFVSLVALLTWRVLLLRAKHLFSPRQTLVCRCHRWQFDASLGGRTAGPGG